MDKAPGIFHEGSVLYARRARRLACLAIEAKIHFMYKLRRQGKFLFAHGADEANPAPGGRLLSQGECVGRTNREAHSAMNAIVDDLVERAVSCSAHDQLGFRRNGKRSAPAAKPPMCAHQATPPASAPMPSERRPLTAC